MTTPGSVHGPRISSPHGKLIQCKHTVLATVMITRTFGLLGGSEEKEGNGRRKAISEGENWRQLRVGTVDRVDFNPAKEVIMLESPFYPFGFSYSDTPRPCRRNAQRRPSIRDPTEY